MADIGVELNVLPRLWTSLGFACQTMPGPARPEKWKRKRRDGLAVPTSDMSEDNIGDEGERNGAPQGAPQGSNDDPMRWTVKEVAMVLLGSLGCAWKPDLCDDSHTDVTVQDIGSCEDDLESMHDDFADAMHGRQSTWVVRCASLPLLYHPVRLLSSSPCLQMQFLSEWEAFTGRHIEPLVHVLLCSISSHPSSSPPPPPTTTTTEFG
jgi:hypothetical protein